MAVERKYERDIDLLLAEEFIVSPVFASWFRSKTKFKDRQGAVSEVFVSKSDSDGESDLVVVYGANDGSKVAVLIEDKVDATLQPEQARRYRKRADREVVRGSFSDYELILCAPEAYPLSRGKTIVRDSTTDTKGLLHGDVFHRFISYEDIANESASSDPSARAQYRADFIRTAAERRANQWVRQQDDATDLFWEAVYRIASEEFPILEMKQRKLTKNSNWITLRPRDMPTQPKWTYIALKGSHGYIDLTFTNTMAHQFAEEIRPLLIDGLTMHQTGASAAVRIATLPFRVEDGLEQGLPRARAAFVAAKQLIEFYRGHCVALDAGAMSATPA